MLTMMFENELRQIAHLRRTRRILWLSVLSLLFVLGSALLYDLPPRNYSWDDIRTIWALQLTSYLLCAATISIVVINFRSIIRMGKDDINYKIRIAIIISLFAIIIMVLDIVNRPTLVTKL